MTTPRAKFAGLALIAALCAGVILGLTAPAWAGVNYNAPRTGEELGKLCAVLPAFLTAKEPASSDALKAQVCLVYIQASLDGIELMALALKRRKAFCLPEGTRELDRANAVVRWLAAHPEEGNLHAATVVVTALANAYPCK